MAGSRLLAARYAAHMARAALARLQRIGKLTLETRHPQLGSSERAGLAPPLAVRPSTALRPGAASPYQLPATRRACGKVV